MRAYTGGTAASTRRACPKNLLLLSTIILTAASAARAEVWTEFEEAVGKLVLAETTARTGRLDDPLLQGWVDRIGGDLMRQSSRRHLRYRFYVLNTDENNAFSLPGGYILVTAGLLNHVTSDEELAGVLGHEVAHSDDRDFARLLREQGIFLGAQGLLRGRVGSGWILASQVAQLLQGFHSSRRHAGQADVVGARLCLAAGYDPRGLLDFLGTLQPQDRGLDRLFATHPGGPERLAATRREVTALDANLAEALALARSLQARGHLRRAAQVAERAAANSPGEPEPLLLLAAVQEQRGEDAAAREALRQAGQAAPQPPAPESLPTALQLPGPLRLQVDTAVTRLRSDSTALHAQEQQLHRRLREFDSDREIAAALQAGQVIAPELNETKYLTTLARAYQVLGRARQEAQRQAEVLSRSVSVRRGWERVAADLTADKVTTGATEKGQQEELEAAARELLVSSGPALQATSEQVRLCAASCADLTAATRMLSVAFLGLLGSGSGQPLGRLNYTRFLLLQADIAAAEARVRRSEQASERGLRVVFEEHLKVTQVALSTLHARAGVPLRRLDLTLIARRIGATEEQLAGELPARSLGQAAATLLGQRVQARGLAALQVQDCLLRIAYLDLLAERGEQPRVPGRFVQAKP